MHSVWNTWSHSSFGDQLTFSPASYEHKQIAQALASYFLSISVTPLKVGDLGTVGQDDRLEIRSFAKCSSGGNLSEKVKDFFGDSKINSGKTLHFRLSNLLANIDSLDSLGFSVIFFSVFVIRKDLIISSLSSSFVTSSCGTFCCLEFFFVCKMTQRNNEQCRD